MLAVVASLLLAAPALAEEEERPVRYEARTEIDFEEGLALEGELVRPEHVLVSDRLRARFNPLIRLRVDFRAEMKRSVREVE